MTVRTAQPNSQRSFVPAYKHRENVVVGNLHFRVTKDVSSSFTGYPDACLVERK